MPTQAISNRVPWILALGMFVIGTTSLSILGLGPALTRDLATDPADSGWLVTAFAATFALAAPLAQFTLGRRLAPRTLILLGASILAASLVWSALAASFQALLIARIASALGGALIAPTSAALAISLVPVDRRGAVLATVFAGFTLATVGGVPIATWLTLWLGWRGAIAAIGLAALVFVTLAAIYMPRDTGKSRPQRKQPSESLRLLAPALLLMGTVGMLSTQFVIYALMGELLGQQFGVGASGLPIAILLFGVLGVAGNAAAGALSDRVGPGPLVWASFGSLAAFLFLMLFDLGHTWVRLFLQDARSWAPCLRRLNKAALWVWWQRSTMALSSHLIHPQVTSGLLWGQRWQARSAPVSGCGRCPLVRWVYWL
mgnify:CR=1 FL=1